MDIIETKYSDAWSKELQEAYQEHAVEFFPQSFPSGGPSDGEEPDEDPEEDPEEDPDEEPEVKTEAKMEQGSKVDPEEDPEEDKNEEPEKELNVKCAERSQSCHRTSVTEKAAEYPASKTALLQSYQTKKRCWYEELVEQEVDSQCSTADLQSKIGMPKAVVHDKNGSGSKEDVSSSGKRRRSRWDDKGDKEDQKCKTRWPTDDSPLNPGPTDLPDFKKYLVGFELDPKVQGLKTRLSEVNSKLERCEIHDERPEAERSPSPQPEYNSLGVRTNTREVRLRQKLIKEREGIITELIKKKLSFEISVKHGFAKFCTKLYVPQKEYPNYNFIGLILGPNGYTQKRMENETGAKIRVRGKGFFPETTNEDLHVYIEARSRESLDAAVSMVEKLLIPKEEGTDEHKRTQLLELSKLRNENVIINICSTCKEPGHDHYACPQRTLKVSSDTCGSIAQPTSDFPSGASPQVSNPPQTPHVLSNHLQTFPVPNNPLQTCPVPSNPMQTSPYVKGNHYKEINAANLFVGYLPQGVDDSRLRELFSPFGTITQSKVARDYVTGISRGYGFVRYDNPTAAASAIMYMNGFEIVGHRLAVRVAGVPPAAAVSPAISIGPVYAGPAAVAPSVPSWPGLPHLMPPEAQMYYPGNGEGLVFPPSSVYPQHNSQFHQVGSTAIPPPVVSQAIEAGTPISSSGSVSVAQSPLAPNFNGSFTTQVPEPSSAGSITAERWN